jgi:hypothetical protein
MKRDARALWLALSQVRRFTGVPEGWSGWVTVRCGPGRGGPHYGLVWSLHPQDGCHGGRAGRGQPWLRKGGLLAPQEGGVVGGPFGVARGGGDHTMAHVLLYDTRRVHCELSLDFICS